MPISTDLDTFTTNYHKGNGATECPVCYDIIKEGKGVKCCNGHEICERHFIERARSIYDEGRLAFHGDDFQKCFLCRTPMEDERFSGAYFKLLRLTQAFGIGKMAGRSHKEIRDEIIPNLPIEFKI